MIKELTFKTSKREEIIDITKDVQKILKESKVREGIVLVYTPHATASIIINENYDKNICVDFLEALNKLIPSGCWRHDKVDNNGASHIKASILGPSEIIPVENNELMLGQWQSIMLVDLDGPRSRKVIIKILD